MILASNGRTLEVARGLAEITIVYEGDPEARPFTREELQRFLEYADDQVERAVRSKRKGALAAFRDATVPSIIGWAVEAVADYVDNVRPRFGCDDHPAMWVTERGGRVKPAEINARFVTYRDALKLPKTLTPHSFVTRGSHLTEDGVDRRFIQGAVVVTPPRRSTHVSSDFMNTAPRRALGPALETPHSTEDGRRSWTARCWTTDGTCGR